MERLAGALRTFIGARRGLLAGALRSDRLAQSSLRLSLGRFSTTAEVDFAVQVITSAVARLRSIAPLPPA